MRQTDLRQTGIAVAILFNKEEREIPLFSSDILLEAYKLMEEGIVKSIVSVYPCGIPKKIVKGTLGMRGVLIEDVPRIYVK